jgi:hypothetical protein
MREDIKNKLSEQLDEASDYAQEALVALEYLLDILDNTDDLIEGLDHDVGKAIRVDVDDAILSVDYAKDLCEKIHKVIEQKAEATEEAVS